MQVNWEVYAEEDIWSCSCDTHMHYGLCKHTYAKAMEDNIITGYPPRKDPTLVGAKKKGRPRRSVGGGAYGRE